MRCLLVLALIGASFFAVHKTEELLMDLCDDKVNEDQWKKGMQCAVKYMDNFDTVHRKMAWCGKKVNGDKDLDTKFETFKETVCKDDKKVQKEALKCAYPPDGTPPTPEPKFKECVERIKKNTTIAVMNAS